MPRRLYFIRYLPNTFEDIGGDLAPYNILLDRSLQSHISEAPELLDDPTLNDETEAARINVGGGRWQ